MVSEATKTDEKISAKPQKDYDGSGGDCVVENEDDEEYDEISVASTSDSQIECDNSGGMVLSEAQDRSPCFQNIEVTNSSDVHFGNKTYYQGPVTIKQILYTNPSQGDGNSDGTENGEHKLPITDSNFDGSVNDGYVTSETVNGAVKNSNCINNINSNNLSSNWTEKTKGKKWLQRRTTKQLILGTAILILVMVSVIVLTLTLLTRYSPSVNHKHTVGGETEPIDGGPNNDPEAKPHLVSRRDWVASPPTRTIPLRRPISKVIISETETNECHDLGDCIFVVRHLQWNHMDGNSLWDIKYNFVVGNEGSIFNGRGWRNLGSTIPNCNENAIGIALIGTFSRISPTELQINSTKTLIQYGADAGIISKDYVVVLASQLLGTDNGSNEKLNEEVETWSHWSPIDYFSNDTLRQTFCAYTNI